MTREHHGNHNHTNSRETKRERFISRGGKSSGSAGRYISIAVVLAMLIAILYVIFGGKSAGQAEYAQAGAAGQDFTLPVSSLNDGKARFYSYDTPDGKKLAFFVIRSSDGVVRAAFDACDVCFKSKRGYHQEGDDMVCNNCGRHFPSASVNVITGGCNPAPLERQVAGDQVVIKASDLVRGQMYF